VSEKLFGLTKVQHKNHSPVDTEKAGRSARPGKLRVRSLRPLQGFWIPTEKLLTFTYRDRISKISLPYWIYTSPNTEEVRKDPVYTRKSSLFGGRKVRKGRSVSTFRSSRIHRTTGNTIQLWEIWFSVVPRDRAIQSTLPKSYI